MHQLRGVRSILADGGDINYQGASGVVDLNDAGEVTAGTYDIYTYDAEGTAVTEDSGLVLEQLAGAS